VGKSGENSQMKERKLFRGKFTYSIDAKSRIAIPAKLRKQINAEANDRIILIQGTAPCIDLYPLDYWLTIEEKLLKLNTFKPDEARFLRMILQNADEAKLDSQSRILLPQDLIRYAKIENEVLILGALKKIEVWSPTVYENYLKASPETYEQIAAKVMV
jgi:transcriptional regulator MraZ